MSSDQNIIFRKIARDFKGRVELTKKLPIETSISLFFELCNFNLNNYIKTEIERYPNKSMKDIIINMYKINKIIERK
ncbi:MAG: hypothetical protein HWN81_23430 [Candidatus Lokiarchaeota archaeon]|nr:hypothetical protein [Candidatus Lokiarchaeota archaeon]